FLLFVHTQRPPRSPLSPYTTLFRSKHGVRFQPALAGTLHVARTNAFFMGGGKALVNAYYRSAEKLGVQVRYETPVKELVFDGNQIGRHTSELQSRENLVCRLLLEKK